MAGLSEDKIVEAAYGLLVQYGLQDVSMRRIAGALDVQPGALYYHVSNKQKLLKLVARRVLGALSGPEESPSKVMRQLRSILLGLRDGGDLALIAYSLDPELPPVRTLSAALENQGHSAESAARHSAMLMRYALGAIAVEQNAQLFDPDHTVDSEVLYTEGLRLLLSD